MMRVAHANDRLGEGEVLSLRGLIAYAAETQALSETLVQTVLLARYNIPDLTFLPAHAYNDALEYLVDLQKSRLIH